ncbi:MAG: hypothetical protein RLY71_1764 [Pseudomonadota bacterium]|jgi:DNA-binding Lrp family transcriptional regulator
MHDALRATADVPLQVDVIDLCLMTRLHGGLPLSERPFADVGAELGLDEDGVIERLHHLLAQGVLSRFGPLFQIERSGGLFVLAALAVPEPRFAEVTELVNRHAEVAHNYRREHALNMWFVVGAESPEAAEVVLAHIEAETGLAVQAFPKEREYHVELRLPLLDGANLRGDAAATALAARAAQMVPPCAPAWAPPADSPTTLSDFDRSLIKATQSGLPLVPQPYEAVAVLLDTTSALVRERLGQMLASGLIRRIGAVPNHYRLGFKANGMTVWDVDDAQIDALGAQIGALPGVSHCYRRPRHLPHWPYNLFAMVHGRSRAEAEQQAVRIGALLGPACRGHDILYSSAILKKTGLRLQER